MRYRIAKFNEKIGDIFYLGRIRIDAYRPDPDPSQTGSDSQQWS
jgi:hypothetical protein